MTGLRALFAIWAGLHSTAFWISEAHAAVPQIFESARPEFAKLFQVVETFEVPRGRQKPFSVVYGNEHYGYFELAPEIKNPSEAQIRFLPPGYRYPIRFYRKTPDGSSALKLIRERKYRSPVPAEFNQIRSRGGEGLQTRFFVIDQTLNLPGRGQLGPFAVILNRLGEIVWMHFPRAQNPIGFIKPHMVIKRAGPGDFQFLDSTETYSVTTGKVERTSTFHRTNIFGITSFERNLSLFPGAPFIHHDFVWDEKQNTLLAIGSEARAIRSDFLSFADHTSFTQKLFHALTGLFFPRVYEVDLIYRFDFNSGKVSKLWDAQESLGFAEDSSVFGESPEKIMAAQNIRSYLSLYQAPQIPGNVFSHNWNYIDWTHLNSLYPDSAGGYLVSSRHLNRILDFDAGLKKVRWTVGLSKKDHFRFRSEESAFSGQHDPSLTRRGTLLVFDNNSPSWTLAPDRKKSRIIEIELDRTNGEAKTIWQARPPEAGYSEKRGSANELSNGDILGYFPTEAAGPGMPSTMRFSEFDYKTRRETASLTSEVLSGFSSYKALPLDALGEEVPVSLTVLEGKRPARH